MGSPTPPRGTSSPLTLQARWPGGLTPLEAVSLNPAGAVAYIEELRARAERAEAEVARLREVVEAARTIAAGRYVWSNDALRDVLARLDADAPPRAPDLDATVKALREARACGQHGCTRPQHAAGGCRSALGSADNCDACARLAVEAVLAGGAR